MALDEIHAARLDKVVGAFISQHRPLLHVRPKLDLGYRLNGQSVEIFEGRPRWRGAPAETMRSSVAKATYVTTRGVCKVFWRRADLKRHVYPPAPQVGSIEAFLKLVAEDKHACFFG